MSKIKKALALLLCTLMIVSASALATIAYLTDSEAVVNTFSVGQVGISLDETDVNPDGTVKEPYARDKENEYHLIPGSTYTKDPIIHVDDNSENCYVFVKVVNPIEAYESKEEDYNSIAKQIKDNGWTALDGVENVYYKEYIKGQTDKDLEVFEGFKIDGQANKVDGWDAITPETTRINVTGYAVQMAGFGSAKDAWDAADFPEDAGSTEVDTAEAMLSALATGGRVTLTQSITFSEQNNINCGPGAVLDLNGKTITFTVGQNYVSGDLTITGNGKMVNDTNGGTPFGIYDGTTTIENGTYDNSIYISGLTGYLTINGGTFTASLQGNPSRYTVTGGTFNSHPGSYVNSATHEVTYSDGWYTVTAK